MKVNIGNYENGDTQDFSIKIDEWDLYSLDCTMSLIIHPLLVRFKESTKGHPVDIQDESIPSEIESDEEKWDWILGEMIYAHDESLNQFSDVNYMGGSPTSRRDNGLRLFGKFYLNLWS